MTEEFMLYCYMCSTLLLWALSVKWFIHCDNAYVRKNNKKYREQQIMLDRNRRVRNNIVTKWYFCSEHSVMKEEE